MFFPNNSIDPSLYGKVEITGTGGEIPEGCGIKWLPYVMQEHTPESLQRHKDFMNEYHAEHKECPKCGSNRYESTLFGYILDTSKPEEYKDLNSAKCLDCGDVHTIHERVTIKF